MDAGSSQLRAPRVAVVPAPAPPAQAPPAQALPLAIVANPPPRTFSTPSLKTSLVLEQGFTTIAHVPDGTNAQGRIHTPLDGKLVAAEAEATAHPPARDEAREPVRNHVTNMYTLLFIFCASVLKIIVVVRILCRDARSGARVLGLEHLYAGGRSTRKRMVQDN